MAWIHTDNPNLRSLKIPQLSDEVFFTTNQYAEVSASVAEALGSSSKLSGITEVSEPADPGEYYGSDHDNLNITISLDNGDFDGISVVGTASIDDADIDDTTTQRLFLGQLSTEPTVSDADTVAVWVDESDNEIYKKIQNGDPVQVSGSGSGASTLAGLDNVSVNTLANQPASGSAGDWYFTSDQNGVYHDPDGNGWDLIAEHPSNISAAELGFDPATQSELDTHAGTADAHHAKTTSSEIDHDATTNFVANEHVDHSTISITGSTYITGGGAITSSRTLQLTGDTDALDGSLGTDGQVWTSTGTGARWEAAPSGSGSPGGTDTQIQYNNGGSFGGVSGFTHDDAAGTLTGVPSVDDTLGLADQAADPAANGEIQRNGTDVKVYSGGAVRNMSDIGTGTSGGSAVILDLGDDGSNESTDLQEIATTNDTNGVVTEPTADKALIDMSANWPTADDVPDTAVDHDATTNFVANEHIDHSTVSITGSTYITGGGDLTASRTLSLTGDTNALDGSAGTDGQVWTSTGTGAQWEAVPSGGSAVEVAEDGTSLTTDVSLIDVLGGLTASEPTADQIDLTVNESEVDHDSLQNFVANEHIDHSTISVSGGASLTGGGDLTASRTLDVADDGIGSAEIAHGTVKEAHLDITDLPSDGEILSWNDSQVQFEWVAQNSGSGPSVIEAPNGHIQAVELQDSANSDSGSNEYSEITEYVTSAQTITIYRWGGYVVSDDNQTTGTALEVSLIQQDGTVVQSATTANASNSSGITGASYSPSADEVVKMRVTNTTGEDVTSAGAIFGYEVV